MRRHPRAGDRRLSRRLLLLQLHLPLLHLLQHLLRRLHSRLIRVLLLLLLLVNFLCGLIRCCSVICVRRIVVLLLGIRCVGRRFLRRGRIVCLRDSQGGIRG